MAEVSCVSTGQTGCAHGLASQAQPVHFGSGSRCVAVIAGLRISVGVHAPKGMGEGNGRACKAGAHVRAVSAPQLRPSAQRSPRGSTIVGQVELLRR